MTQQDKEQLKLEIDHIFESGANEIRIFEMVVNFIDSRNGVNKNFVLADVSGQSEQLCGFFEPDNSTSSATKCKCGREKWEHPKAT